MAFIKKCEGIVTSCCKCAEFASSYVNGDWFCSSCAQKEDEEPQEEEKETL